MEILKVSAQSDASATAGALANTVRESGEAELQGIGPKAINQAVKAIAIARSYLASSGVDLIAMPSFVDVEINGENRTALRFSIMPRHRLHQPHQPHEDGRPTDGAREKEADEARDGEFEGQSEIEDEIVPSRPTSLSEAITGRPASELSDAEDPDATDRSDAATDDTDVNDGPDRPERSEESERHADEADEDEENDQPERRSSFLERFRRSGFDTDRDVS